jgi:hypothetical protein
LAHHVGASKSVEEHMPLVDTKNHERASTSTVDYVVTDQFGTTATATRTVIVE